MSNHSSSRVGRSRVLGVLVTVCVALGLSAVPGVAAAAPPRVTPILDCYRENTDGTTTLVLGYTSTRKGTVTIDHWNKNTLYPSKYDGSQPEVFEEGTHRGAFSLSVSAADLPSFRWELDKTDLSFDPGSASACADSTPLPALGNGTGLAIVLVAAGVVGGFSVRRGVRRSAARA